MLFTRRSAAAAAGVSAFSASAAMPIATAAAAAAGVGLAFFAAFTASLGVVLKTAFGVALLVIDRMHEVLAAVVAGDRFVFVCHMGKPPLGCEHLAESEPINQVILTKKILGPSDDCRHRLTKTYPALAPETAVRYPPGP